MKDTNQAVLRHSAAHLLGHAVSELFPGTLLTIGPATEEGFFYDFLPLTPFKEEDLAVISTRMQKLAEKNYPLEHREISKEEARKIYHNNPFKLELIDQIPGTTVGLSTQGDFVDLCRGGHVASTGFLKHFKLTGISGSYWRADRSKQALQRISGIVFPTAQELEAYEKQKEEAERNDHRRLGKQLELFSFHEEGPGFPFYHPKGKKIINLLIDYMRSLHDEYNYQEIATPALLQDTLWKQSGHYSHYKDKMYFCSVDNQNYALKPMNCPGAILVYAHRPRSYRELPLKLAEFGHVHRYELSGVMHGLLRARAFTQDDAHIFCTLDQVEDEISTILTIIFKILQRTGFEKITFALSTRPEESMGSDHAWEKATLALKNALDKRNLSYDIQEGEGAFYGPKIEVMIEDSMGRKWQCGTVQVDFLQPENFDLWYVSPQGTYERPVIIHQALYGSLERFFAIVLEHTKGNLPFWLAPIQGRILPITDQQISYAQELCAELKKSGMRIEIDTSSDPLSGKIKRAQLDKIPWMLVLGGKEQENKTITLRYITGKQDTYTREALMKKFDEQNTL